MIPNISKIIYKTQRQLKEISAERDNIHQEIQEKIKNIAHNIASSSQDRIKTYIREINIHSDNFTKSKKENILLKKNERNYKVSYDAVCELNKQLELRSQELVKENKILQTQIKQTNNNMTPSIKTNDNIYDKEQMSLFPTSYYQNQQKITQ